MIVGICIGIGLLMIAYGVFIAAANAGTHFYMVWIAMGVVLLVLAATFYFKIWTSLDVWVRFAVYGLGIVLAVWLCVSLVLVLGMFGKRIESGADVIIVLGCQIIDDHPSKVLAHRLDAAARYLSENENTACIVSGGQGINEPVAEAVVMKEYLISKGIDESRIITEEKSENTTQNIIYSKALLPEDTKSVGIVTSDFHLFRGVSIAKKYGLPDVSGTAAYSNRAYLLNNILRECMAVTKDFVIGNM